MQIWVLLRIKVACRLPGVLVHDPRVARILGLQPLADTARRTADDGGYRAVRAADSFTIETVQNQMQRQDLPLPFVFPRIRREYGSRTAPSLLVPPTSWTDGASRQISTCAVFDCHEWEFSQLPPTVWNDGPVRPVRTAVAADDRLGSLKYLVNNSQTTACCQFTIHASLVASHFSGGTRQDHPSCPQTAPKFKKRLADRRQPVAVTAIGSPRRPLRGRAPAGRCGARRRRS